MTETGTPPPWADAIAAKADMPAETVEEVLARHRIRPSPVPGQPRRMTIESIAFAGTKDEARGGQPFAFTWNGLGPGLWAVAAPANFAGKSTVFEVAKSLLRGRLSVQPDVADWLASAELLFRVDDTRYRVAVAFEKRVPSGTLELLKDDETHIQLGGFSSEPEFEQTMGGLMMDRLSLARLSAWRQGSEDSPGRAAPHDWPMLSEALFIGTELRALIGDVVVDGLPARLLQMFVGLPWVSTLFEARTALKQVEEEIARKRRRREAVDARRKIRADAVRGELAAAKARLDAVIGSGDLRRRLVETEGELAGASDQLRRIRAAQREAEAALDQAQAEHDEDLRQHQDFLEAKAAHAVFGRLRPTCCPRCESAIPRERQRRERESLECSVCGTNVGKRDADNDVAERDLAARVEASGKALATARGDAKAIAERLAETEAEVLRLDATLAGLTGDLKGSAEARWTAEADVSRLEGRLEEILADEPETSDGPALELDRRILKACEEVTNDLVKAHRDELLKAISERLAELARRFGMKGVSSARLNGQAQLSLTKGSTETNFSRSTKGERMRLKVATVIAMLQVGEVAGVGRHPGVLFVDSPAGAEEIIQEDVDELLDGLASLEETMPWFQVFVATTKVDAVADRVRPDHARIADGEVLW
ncbi:hypothetical protein JHL17_13365 [Azospirillum sp. YIM B02556]|uniref:Large ATP-binding protein n=1 Tax=Azospirillum endophyticum TaxID=2800326 RepID=A0ABS1F4P8_9PROT|nr:hypothetical protein [Azospirillum endophyticum]MBK1838403.1 hypothetical protein [Azospirillum endophyticum]